MGSEMCIRDRDQMERAFETAFPPLAQFNRWEEGREADMAESRRRWKEYLSRKSQEMGNRLMFFQPDKHGNRLEDDPPTSGATLDLEHRMPETFARLQAFREWENGVRKELATSPTDRVQGLPHPARAAHDLRVGRCE